MNKKLLSLILIFSLIFLSLSKRILLEEPAEKEKEHQENNEEEEHCDSDKQKDETDFSKIHESQIRKENMPHSQVLMPIRRIGTSNMELGHGPCGGVEKKSANTLTNKGSSINVVWEILVPENRGNCTVKISNGKQTEESFKLLQPVEGKINEDGSFACGRVKGFEFKEFILPDDYECDGCTLQWKWTTSYGDIYSCSDIIINGGSLTNCMGKCLNGGSCFNGKCICADGYSGDFCEDKIGEFSLTWLWVLLALAVIGCAGYFCYKYREQIQNLFKKGVSWTTGQGRNNSLPFNEENKNDLNPPLEDNSKQS